MHFVLTMGKTTAMPGLTRDGVGKWIWQLAEEDALPLEEITQEFLPVSICVSLSYLDANLRILIAIIMCICSRRFSRSLPGLRLKRGSRCASTVSRYLTLVIYRLICAVVRDSVARFYGEEISEALFLQVLDDASHRGDRSLEVMCHPAFIDNTIRQSAYCFPRLTELEVLTSASLKYAIAERGYRLGVIGMCK